MVWTSRNALAGIFVFQRAKSGLQSQPHIMSHSALAGIFVFSIDPHIGNDADQPDWSQCPEGHFCFLHVGGVVGVGWEVGALRVSVPSRAFLFSNRERSAMDRR